MEDHNAAGIGEWIAGLQWGHGDEAVEDLYSDLIDAFVLYLLQWGHGDEAVEDDARLRAVCRDSTGFNGATAMKPWKTVVGAGDGAAGGIASMGPRR